VALYDVLKAKKVEDLQQADFDEEVKRRQQVWNQIILENTIKQLKLFKNSPMPLFTSLKNNST
jgi:hypothetical protein